MQGSCMPMLVTYSASQALLKNKIAKKIGDNKKQDTALDHYTSR